MSARKLTLLRNSFLRYMDGSPIQAFRLNSAGGQFANYRASSNAGFANWRGDVFTQGAADNFNHAASD